LGRGAPKSRARQRRSVYHYDASGTSSLETDDAFFQGHYYDEETWLHYNRFRYYDPASGRYISADPIGQAGGVNVYEYALNVPTRFVDPYGPFGTDSCDYYDQACEANAPPEAYECTLAPELCPRFPGDDDPEDTSWSPGNVSNCIRQCLQERHKARMEDPLTCDPNNNIGDTGNIADHTLCIAGCSANPENPYNPFGQDLPDNTPSL
jgi:RHS repeat-associated protein